VVSSDAHRAIIDGWAAGRATRCVHDDAAHSRTAYVLRVRHPSRHPSTRGPRPGATDAGCDGPPRAACPTDYSRGAWFGWARALCERGGAIVLWDVLECGGRRVSGGVVHEPRAEAVLPYGMGAGMGGPDARGAGERAEHPGRFRAVRLEAGRLVPASPPWATPPASATVQEGRP
jgi:hypothetical protein